MTLYCIYCIMGNCFSFQNKEQINHMYDVICERHSRDRKSIEDLHKQISDLLTENAKLQSKYDDIATKYGLVLSGSTNDYVRQYYQTI